MGSAFQPTKRSFASRSQDHTPKVNRRASTPSTPTSRPTTIDPSISTPASTPFRGQNEQPNPGTFTNTPNPRPSSSAHNPLRSVLAPPSTPAGPPPVAQAFMPSQTIVPQEQPARNDVENQRPLDLDLRGVSDRNYGQAPSTPGAIPRSQSFVPESFTPRRPVAENGASHPMPTMELPAAANPGYIPSYVRNFVGIVQTRFPADRSQTVWTRKVVEILCHLACNRASDLEPFSQDCFKLYREKYSETERSRRVQKEAMTERNPPEVNVPNVSQPQPNVHRMTQPDLSSAPQNFSSGPTIPIQMYENHPDPVVSTHNPFIILNHLSDSVQFLLTKRHCTNGHTPSFTSPTFP